MDKIGADFNACVESIRDRLGAKAVPIQLPIGSEASLKGLVDLVRMKAVVWDADGLGANYHDEEIPADMKDEAVKARHYMIENAVELDDEAMEAYLNGEEPSEAVIKKCLRKAVLNGAFYPILCGSAFKNKGVQPLLDAVVDYLPSPVDIPPTCCASTSAPKSRSCSHASDDEPLSILAFKIMDDPFVGSLTFCRIYSGKLESGMGLLNSTRDKRERVGRMPPPPLLLMHSNNREDIKLKPSPATSSPWPALKDTRTGETLCDPSKSPVILEKMDFPDPVIELSIEPKTKADQEKLGVALQKLAQEDPSFRVSTDHESGQTILKGMGELHLDIKVDILRRTYKVDANVGAPQVAYRESLGRKCEIDYTHKKQTGGSGQFARIKIVFEPGEPGSGFQFEYKVVGGGSVPPKRIHPRRRKRASPRPRKTVSWPASR